jgi:hypothetical protein
MAHVNVHVNANGAGFSRTMDALENRVHGLSHSLTHGLKEAFVGLVGAGSVGLLVENMVSYAESIDRASERLGIATDRVQQLRKVAQHAGKDLEVWDAIFRNVDKNAQKALVPGSKEANVADQLGLSNEDLKHLNKDELLKKALESTKSMGRTEAEGLIAGLVGPKNAGFVLGHREDILSGKGNIVSDSDLAALVEFKHSLEDLTDVVRVAIIPALVSFAHFLTDLFAHKVDNEKSLSQMDAEAAAINSNKGGKEPSWWARVKAEAKFENVATGIVTGTDEEKKKVYDKAKEDYITGLYGADVYKDMMKTFEPPPSLVDKLKEAQDARKKAREEEQNALKGDVNRVAPVTKTAAAKDLIDKDIKGNNAFLKIGGLLGVDGTYRLERLSQETNNLLRIIAKNTTPEANSDATDTTDFTD